MPEDRLVSINSSTSIHPDSLMRKTFPIQRKGFDPEAVTKYLEQIAQEMNHLIERENRTRQMLIDTEAKLTIRPSFDEDTLTEALGQETARILSSAREASRDLLARTGIEAQELKDKAERILAERTVEAEQVAAEIVQKAESDAQAVLESAQANSQILSNEVKEQCRGMVREAQEARARILSDLVRKRRTLNSQVEQLQAAKNLIFDTMLKTRSQVDSVAKELEHLEQEAKYKAEHAGLAATLEDDPSEEELIEIASKLPRSADFEAGNQDSPQPDTDRPASSDPAANVNTPNPTEQIEHQLEAEVGTFRIQADSQNAQIKPLPVETVIEGLKNEDKRVDLHENTPPEIDPFEIKAPKIDLSDEPPGEGIRILGIQPETENLESVIEESNQPDMTVTKDNSIDSVSAIFKKIKLESSDLESQESPGVLESSAVQQEDSESLDSNTSESSNETNTSSTSSNTESVEQTFPETDSSQTVDSGHSDSDLTETLIHRRNELLNPIVAGLVRKIKRVLSDEQNELLDGLRRLKGKVSLEELLPKSTQESKISEAIKTLIRDGMMQGNIFVNELISGQVPKIDYKDTIDKLASELSAVLTQSLRSKINWSDLPETEDSESRIIDLVTSGYREWKGSQLESFVLDYAFQAFSIGTVLCIEKGTKVKWILDPSEGSCPDCQDNTFEDGVEIGESFPTGQSSPPAHLGCRCLLIPQLQ